MVVLDMRTITTSVLHQHINSFLINYYTW